MVKNIASKMKALLLAAGLGTRLLPHTETIPKPLFPIGGRPLIDVHIEALINAGCNEIVVNTHHLHTQIEQHIKTHPYPVPVHTCHEPEILGTGGAIKNLEGFWDTLPFFVVNSDIYSTIDLAAVYRFHIDHAHPATLVLVDWPDVNTVCVGGDGLIAGFDPDQVADYHMRRTFTGIQVLEPEILDYIPAARFSSSIDAFGRMIKDGKTIKAYLADHDCWTDIGTPERYADTVYRTLAPRAFKEAFARARAGTIYREKLAGDGSDRSWYRLVSDHHSLVMVSHGIQTQTDTGEFDAFVAIGRHLRSREIPVPRIYLEDRFSGLVFLEDLGDIHLQTLIRNAGGDAAVLSRYRDIIDLMIRMNISGDEGFDTAWTYQTAAYDAELILRKECRYFVEAFLDAYCRLTLRYEDFADEFVALSQKALQYAVTGFMHRDFQSRNIMVKENRPFLIDFQGARRGPLQYDLASLVIDPYVGLCESIRKKLVQYCAAKLSRVKGIDTHRFLAGYRYCAVTRNLQILGAFGYLTRTKKKPGFETYIPTAIRTLKASVDPDEFPKLSSLAKQLNRMAESRKHR